MIKASFTAYTLNFKIPAGTSRGVLQQKPIWLLKLQQEDREGVGEVSFIDGLSCETETEILNALSYVCNSEEIDEQLLLVLNTVPSVRFALEQALMDLKTSGSKLLFDSPFTRGEQGIAINGLVWMGDKHFMRQQIKEKISDAYSCIKLKIGAIGFEDELSLIQEIRDEYSINDLEIRVDANGAFSSSDALEKLKRLAEYDLHSIEQPIKAGQADAMAQLCSSSPLAIALDEELIGIHTLREKEKLIQHIQPHYIILKPSLLGGYKASQEWIDLATKYKSHWWITSALESNIGLNAIAQWTATLNCNIPQGLGTGSLYTNNFNSPLEINKGKLFYRTEKKWAIDV